MQQGLAGRIAQLFINSKLSLLLILAFLLAGIYAASIIPREEEPQIEVPIADLFFQYPGATPREMETKVVQPLEHIISNIDGVEYVYSSSMEEQAMVTVQYYVNEDIERSLVKLYSELMKHMDQMPHGLPMPLIKERSINDVPVLTLTLWSETYDDYQLGRIAEELNTEIEKVEDVAITTVIGGRSRQVRITPDKDKLAEVQLDILDIMQSLQANNKESRSGTFNRNDEQYLVKTGSFLRSAEDVGDVVIGTYKNRPVYLRQVAEIADGPEEPDQYVSFGYGRASGQQQEDHPSDYPAITLTVAKRPGADAMRTAEDVLEKVDALKTSLLPDDVNLDVTRNYGVTANQKVSELLLHLASAILAVTIVVFFAMGWRGGLVVFLSVPITFALTLFSYYFLGYTLNRITLFALVFVTGIVVDDSIIIAENMHRHFKMDKLPFRQAALYAINEVGNPTILATFTVVAAVLPMAFVSGLMGPYMSPMPIGAAMAMLFSLLVALTLTPYLGYHILRVREPHKNTAKEEEDAVSGITDTWIYRTYFRLVSPLLDSGWKRWVFLGTTFLILLATMLLFYYNAVAVKMLPFDNKNEFQVIIDMPEGTTLERSASVAREIGFYLSRQDEVVSYQTYTGTAAPINFNGLVRHYDLRSGAHVADVQVNLTEKHDRKIQSHDIAKKYRGPIQEIGEKYGANIKVVEVPPGPPVRSTLVAEIYGPSHDQQVAVAEEVRHIMANTDNVVDVDWMVEADQTQYQFLVDKEKAALNGIAPQEIVQAVNMALSHRPVIFLQAEDDHDPVGITMALSEAERSSLQDLQDIELVGGRGNSIPLGDLVDVREYSKPKAIHHKNQRRVVYVTADMAGALESPVYAILDMGERLNEIDLPAGYFVEEAYSETPILEDNFTIKWDGEWRITLEVFRDLGTAFGVVLVIIYILIVGWFQNFKAPLVMMVAIPLSLIGIILGHYFFGAYFTATSMIGLIALAGIMVRNSVLLIDFINLRLDAGISFKQAVVEAGAVRTTPILLTAGTVVIGAFVILFDPIFQGLAISLMGGTIASTVLTLLVVPLVYYLTERKNYPGS